MIIRSATNATSGIWTKVVEERGKPVLFIDTESENEPNVKMIRKRHTHLRRQIMWGRGMASLESNLLWIRELGPVYSWAITKAMVLMLWSHDAVRALLSVLRLRLCRNLQRLSVWMLKPLLVTDISCGRFLPLHRLQYLPKIFGLLPAPINIPRNEFLRMTITCPVLCRQEWPICKNWRHCLLWRRFFTHDKPCRVIDMTPNKPSLPLDEYPQTEHHKTFVLCR